MHRTPSSSKLRLEEKKRLRPVMVPSGPQSTSNRECIDDDSDEEARPRSVRRFLEEFDRIEDGDANVHDRNGNKSMHKPAGMQLSVREEDDENNLGAEEDGLLYQLHKDQDSDTAKEKSKRTRRCRCTAFIITACVIIFLSTVTIIRLAIQRKPHDPLTGWDYNTNGVQSFPDNFLSDVIPIPCHSHNDYWRKIPLFSALSIGCISVEADVWLFDDENLYIGHNTASLTTNRTFRSLYVNPLVDLLELKNKKTPFYDGNDNGVFDTNTEQTFTLLIDVKTGGEETFLAVLEQLQPLRDRNWLSYVESGILHQRPITVVGTGNTPFDVLTSNTTYRDAFFDAPLDRMYEPAPNSTSASPSPSSNSTARDIAQGSIGISESTDFNQLNSFYASTSYDQIIGTAWWGQISDAQKEMIRGQIRGALKRGLRPRYWDTPAWPVRLRNKVWRFLVEEGASVLNVDDLEGIKGYW